MDELEEIKIGFASFKSKVEEWMSGAVEYRKSAQEEMRKLQDKIDILVEKISKLPCEKRVSIYESFGNQLRLLWVFVTGIVVAVFIEWFKK